MKKLFACLLVLMCLLNCVTPVLAEKKLKIVAATFAEYDWLRNLTRGREDKIDLKLLLDSGMDMHNFQPTFNDIVTISDCDLFVFTGGESDDWAWDVLETAGQGVRYLVLLDVLGEAAKMEQLVEGMQAEEEEEEEAADEHIWLSLRNAQVLCLALRDALIALDSADQAVYEANCASYIEKLQALDAAYQQMVDASACHTLLFADRFPFRYWADDYGIQYYAAFAGCSAESEASFETIIFLIEKVDELGLQVVMKLENSSDDIARTVVEGTRKHNQKILSVNSMQSVTAKDVEAGATYLGIMESNLSVFAEALK